MSKYKLLRHMVDEQIRREGEFSSFMVRAGLLRDMLETLDPTEPASVDSRRMAETEGLGSEGPTSAVEREPETPLSPCYLLTKGEGE